MPSSAIDKAGYLNYCAHLYFLHNQIFFRNMNKKLFFLLPMLFLGAFLMFTPGCGEADPCKEVVCGDGGDCFLGECGCKVGYDKDATGNCVESRIKFIGTYNTTESCTPVSTGSYANNITASTTDISKIIISNFGDSGQNAVATVDGSKATLESTILQGATTTGDGTISGNTLTFTYTSKSAAGVTLFTCTKTMRKI